MVSFSTTVVVAAFLAVYENAGAWMPSTKVGTRNRIPMFRQQEERGSFSNLNAENSEVTTENDKGEDPVEAKPAVEWGVSYIGGDPCGSKYNSDPFDKKPSDKPGMPDDMKARIAALAEKKLKEARESENQ